MIVSTAPPISLPFNANTAVTNRPHRTEAPSKSAFHQHRAAARNNNSKSKRNSKGNNPSDDSVRTRTAREEELDATHDRTRNRAAFSGEENAQDKKCLPHDPVKPSGNTNADLSLHGYRQRVRTVVSTPGERATQEREVPRIHT